MTSTFDRLRVPAGELLFAEGDPASCAYVIEDGEIEIWLVRGGEKIVVARRGVGDVVGEMAIVDDSGRSASATAVTDCVLFEISAEQFRHRTEAMDPVMRTCLTIMLDRFRATMRMIDRTSATVAQATPTSAIPVDNAALDRLMLEREIRHAIASGQFELHYQPIVDIQTREIAGFEALSRWRHPERGLVSPTEFIPVAEESGAIGDLTRWAARCIAADIAAITDAPALAGRTRDDLFISVNISPVNLAESAIADDLAATLSGIDPSRARVKLELTESALMRDPDNAVEMLHRFRSFGFTLAIDDFGTGYSSLAYLARLPIATLKIDRSFVTGIEREPAKFKIARTIVMLARELGLTTVAEGIETPEQEACLAELGCNFGQGYLYGRAARPQDLAAIAARQPASQALRRA